MGLLGTGTVEESLGGDNRGVGNRGGRGSTSSRIGRVITGVKEGGARIEAYGN